MALKPGRYLNVPFSVYLKWSLMSQSVLKQGRKSMLHLRYAMDHPIDPPTDAMMLGSALHTTFLEPEMLPERVVLWEGPRRAGAEWEAFKQENLDRIILTPGCHEKLIGMVRSLRGNAEVRKWLGRIEAIEVSQIGEINGVPFKGRVDAITDDPLWDLKAIASVDDRCVFRTIDRYGYHIQAYCYRELFDRERFCLAFVEATPPHDVRVVEFSEAWLALGQKETINLLDRYKWCERNDTWPGVSSEIEVIEPPAWLAGDEEPITLGGEPMYAGDEGGGEW